MSGGVLLLAGSGLRGRRRLGIVVTVVVLVIAAVGIAAGLVVSRQGALLLDAVADDAEVAHLVLEGDPDAIAAVASDPEVVAFAGPFEILGLELIVSGEKVPFIVTALDSPAIDVNRPPMRSGRWAEDPQELVLDRSVGVDLGIAVGDDVTLRLGDRETSFTVVGTAVNLTDCFYPQCEPGRAWITSGGLARIDTGVATSSTGWLRFDDPAQADPFVQRLARAGVEGITGTESWLDTRADFLTLDRVFGSFVAAFGVFVLAVAAVVIAGSTSMRIVARRREIGLLGAIGCTPRQIVTGLLVENLALGVIAAFLGWLVGGWLAPSLQLGIGRTIGVQHPTWSLSSLLVCLVAISTVLVAATIVPGVAAARRPVTDVLRDVPGDRVSWINRRLRGLPDRLSLLGAQETASQPTRSALAALAIVVAIVGTLVSVGFIGGIGAVTDEPARAGSPWDLALIPGASGPNQVVAAIEDTPDIAAWYSESPRRSTFESGAFLSIAMSSDPDAADFRIAEGRSIRARDEAIAGYGFLERFDVAVGDEITFLAGTTPIAVEIVGWYRETEDSGEILRYSSESLSGAEPGVVPEVYRLVVDEGATPEAVAAALSDRLGPDSRTEVLDTGIDDLAPLMAVLWLIAIVLLVMAAVNLLSTLLTSSREASRRIGVQLAVGVTPRQMLTQGAVSGALLGIISSLVAVPLGYWLFRTLSDVISTSLGVGPAWLPAPSITSVLVIVVATSIVTAGLGATAVARNAFRPASELVRGE